jgi:hypothetical protein
MLARMNWVLIAALMMGGATMAGAQTAPQGRGTAVAMVSFRVPEIVKVVEDPTAVNEDGSPVLRIISNVPAIRALAARGLTPEVLRRPGVRYEVEGRGKGGEAAIRGDATVEPGLVRYTIVQP